ncbi:hypothetical protein CBS101457_005219 [Exobasidium rhododendri]|nr:hypothetical protein CBS101457_005219 [Exobasidium rhododendri]
MISSAHPLHGSMFISFILLFIFGCLLSSSLLFLLLWVIVSRSPSTTGRSSLGRSAAVVVLGDVGRSPRMCYHAQSLAEDGWRVAVVGYSGTPPPPALRRSSVKHHHLARPGDNFLNKIPRIGLLFTLIAAPLKLIGQSAALFWTLAGQVKPPPELIIVQTPPALPTLFVVRLVGLLLGSKIIIDWHNLSYTILSLRFRPESPIVRLAQLLERWTGRGAFAHLCVTQSLKQHLQEVWKVKGPVKVLYDRPPSHFRRATSTEMHKLLGDVATTLDPPLDDWFPAYKAPKTTPFTGIDGLLRQDRPALVVSSTSWTADEDFDMLVQAASIYEKRARELNQQSQADTATPTLNRSATPLLDSPMNFSHEEEEKRFPLRWEGGSGRDKSKRVSVTSVLPEAKHLPKMVLIVTGKGELRDHYVREIARLEKEEAWQYVRIRTAWLKSEEYPILLGSADLGVSLHSSSSGMDLPMKVVDMLGCGTPVCALGFPCIGELIQHGQNGLVFYHAKQLASQLESLLGKHPDSNWLTERMSSMDSLFPDQSALSSRSLSQTYLQQQQFGVQGDLLSESSRGSSPPLSPLLIRPPSPLPTFTLLASPTFAPSDPNYPTSSNAGSDGGGGGGGGGGRFKSKSRNWSENWKQVVRPLLVEADEAEEATERMERWESNHHHHQRDKFWFAPFWKSRRGRGMAKLMRKKSDSITSALSTPRSSTESSPRSEDYKAGGASGIAKKFDEDSILPRSSPKQLRHRTNNRSLAWTGGLSSREGLAGLISANDGHNMEGIPGIEISPAENT